MAKILKYKGITFDDFTEDEYGIWSQMCKKCQAKYADRISDDYEIQQEGGGVCGVCGCHESDLETDIEVNYIDFDINGVEFVEVSNAK